MPRDFTAKDTKSMKPEAEGNADYKACFLRALHGLRGGFVFRFNDRLAIASTRAFGTMWVFYLFFLFGFVPVLWPGSMEKLLYWSNTIQLWALPLLMVGQHLLGRDSERRAQETHDAVMEEIRLLKTMCSSADVADGR